MRACRSAAMRRAVSRFCAIERRHAKNKSPRHKTTPSSGNSSGSIVLATGVCPGATNTSTWSSV
jgi:hypothetical protein